MKQTTIEQGKARSKAEREAAPSSDLFRTLTKPAADDAEASPFPSLTDPRRPAA